MAQQSPNLVIDKYAGAGREYTVSGTDMTQDDIDICHEDGVECSDFVGNDFTVIATCNGGPGTQDDGGWVREVYQPDGDIPYCFKSLTICYNKGQPAEECYVIDENYQYADLPEVQPEFEPNAHPNSYSQCLDSGEAGNPDNKTSDGYYKEYCLWGYNKNTKNATGSVPAERYVGGNWQDNGNNTKVKGDTGDDMLRLRHDARAIIEYIDIGENDAQGDGLKVIERNAANGSNDMMLPMGPKGTYDDYRAFFKNSMPNVTVSNACYSADVYLECEDFDPNPPATCGDFALREFLFRPVGTPDPKGLCAVGTASTPVIDSANGFNYTWTCSQS